mgnify:CR=1 FL=1
MRFCIFLFIILFWFSCSNDTDENAVDCSSTACTSDIRVLYVNIKNKNGSTVSLDSYKVTTVAKSKDITPQLTQEQFEDLKQQGSYPIFSDFSPENERNKSLSIVFSGFIDSNEVLSQEYLVGSDCCHVKFFEGDTDIIIEY